MKLDSFREILVRKTECDPNLRSFAKHVGEDFLASIVIDSLKKMARNTNAGKRANNAVRMFANSMDTTPDTEGEIPKMIRGAIGHHVSHYKAALKNKSEAVSVTDKTKHQRVADAHAEHALKVMHMADKVEKHSPAMENGKKSMSIDYVSPHAWEKHTRRQRNNPDKYNDTKGLGNWNHANEGFEYLQGNPHPSFEKEISRHGHTGAYPFEEVKINGKHIHVDDNVDASGSSAREPNKHSFDHHPIMSHFNESPTKRDESSDKNYVDSLNTYQDSKHMDDYYDGEEAAEKADPKAYAERGGSASDPVHGTPAPKTEDPEASDEPQKQEAKSSSNEEDDILKRLAEMNPEKYGHLVGDKE